MRKPIAVNQEHKILLDNYLYTICESIEDVSNESKYNDFKDVLNIIIDYHNEYSKNNLGSYSDFMSIIPLNTTSCFSGFLAGVETKRNRPKCRAYKVLLTNLSHDLIDKLENLKLEED